jgi:predicted RNA-binding Zn-ribbon protein involved in translation (DUF1610 family)
MNEKTAADMLVEKYKTALNLVGPKTSETERQGMRLHKCRRCTPEEPQMYECPICGFATDAKWRMQIHVAIRSELCIAWGEKKEKAWSRDVGLDG